MKNKFIWKLLKNLSFKQFYNFLLNQWLEGKYNAKRYERDSSQTRILDSNRK